MVPNRDTTSYAHHDLSEIEESRTPLNPSRRSRVK